MSPSPAAGAGIKPLPAPHREYHAWAPIAQLRKAEVHMAGLNAIIDGLRAGIDVKVLRAQVRPATDRSAGPDRTESALVELGIQYALTTDPDEAADLARRIDALKQRQPSYPSAGGGKAREPETFTLNLETFERAVRSLLLHSSVPREQADAADLILRNLSVTTDPHTRSAHFRCFMRLPTADGAVLLAGPFTWEVAFRPARGGLAARQALGHNAVGPRPRASVTAKLRSAGLSEDAAKMAVAAPFKWHVPALLHAASDEPTAADMPADWCAKPFLDWLCTVYLSPNFTAPRNRRYMMANLTGQLLVRAITELGGAATVTKLLDSTPINTTVGIRKAASSERTTLDSRDGTLRKTPFLVPVNPAQRAKTRKGELTVPVCHCGAPGTWVCSAPEIPRGMLCANLHMIDAAEFDMPLDVVFPSDYTTLAPAPVDSERWLTRNYSLRDNPPLGRTAAAILQLHGLKPPLSMTTREVSEAVGVEHPTGRASLHGLARHGRILVIGEHLDRRWQLNDDPNLPPVILRADAIAALTPDEDETDEGLTRRLCHRDPLHTEPLSPRS